MKIVETYSHLNGLEFLLVHKPDLWEEIKDVIIRVDAEECKTKISKEKTMDGKLLYSPKALNKNFKKLLTPNGWHESRVNYWVTKSEKLIRKTLMLPTEEQKKRLRRLGRSQFLATIKQISLKTVLLLKSNLVNMLL